MSVKLAVHSSLPVLHAGLQAMLETEASEQFKWLELPYGRKHKEWVALAAQAKPDLVIVDAEGRVPYPLLSELRDRIPETRVVLWVARSRPHLAKHALDFGVRGMIQRDIDAELLVRCLNKVAAGEMWFERRLTDWLIGSLSVQLSPREFQLLVMVTQGMSNREIATVLGLKEGTVKYYFSRLFRKCGVSDRLELVFCGMRNLFSESLDPGWNMPEWSEGEWPRTLLINSRDTNLRS
jgi:DNA-binding NarL/FixJ family response regulator